MMGFLDVSELKRSKGIRLGFVAARSVDSR